MPDDLSIEYNRMIPEGEQTMSATLNCVSPKLRRTSRRAEESVQVPESTW
jgi:hypothetical protein